MNKKQLYPNRFQVARAFTCRFISFKSVTNLFQTYFRTGLAKLVWNRFGTFWLRSHDGQIDWNWFQIDLTVSCEQVIVIGTVQINNIGLLCQIDACIIILR